MPQSPTPYLLLMLLSLCTFAPVHAANALKPDTPSEYSYALPLQVSGKQGVVAFQLPQAVYLNAKTANLDDLRVVDANGVAQPHALHRPQVACPSRSLVAWPT